MKYRLPVLVVIAVGVFSLFDFSTAHAAVFSITPSSSEIGIGETVTIELRIDGEGVSFNAAQAVIRFPKSILEVTSLDKEGSAFNFWLEEPKFLNSEGVILFIGGTPYGVSGNSIKILRIRFKAKGAGSGTISLTESAITASDGSGTNILTKINDGVVVVGPTRVVPDIPEPQQKIPEPEQITRQPVTAQKLPVQPVISVPLYPQKDSWHNVIAQFIAHWDLPPDISGVNTAFDKNPNAVLSGKSEGLFDSKTFPSLADGIWYLHVRFQNSVGWGQTAHYRIAIDTQAPLPFRVGVPTGLANDNPSPEISFATQDVLSGINRYEIMIDSEAPIIADGQSYKFSPHPPGIHTVSVSAYDIAGNSIQDRVNIEILPIESPIITFITNKLIIGEDNLLLVRGSALPGIDVIVRIENSDGFLVLQENIHTSSQGEWEFRLDRELERGKYNLSALAKDERGALSNPTATEVIAISEKPVISIFGLDITMRWLLVILVVAIIVSAAWIYRKTILRLARSQRETIIISRDLKNASEMIKKRLETIGGIMRKDTLPEARDIEFKTVKKQIVDALDSVAKYISGDIERLK